MRAANIQMLSQQISEAKINNSYLNKQLLLIILCIKSLRLYVRRTKYAAEKGKSHRDDAININNNF